MVHISSIATVLFISCKTSMSAPFLLDLFNHGNIRREGKEISDGYGVPEDSYGVPEDSYGVPEDSYGAPEVSTTTLPPCSGVSYQPTTTSAPAYGAPQQQQQPAFPDILGIIGNILKPKQQPATISSSYEAGCLSPPANDAYQAPESDAYQAPESDSYQAPESDSYQAPESDSYQAPESESYQAPDTNLAVNERKVEA